MNNLKSQDVMMNPDYDALKELQDFNDEEDIANIKITS